jgi:acetyl esterase/lipase
MRGNSSACRIPTSALALVGISCIALLLGAHVNPASAQRRALPPLPPTLSPEIRVQLEEYGKQYPSSANMTVQQSRERADRIQAAVGAEQRKKYAVTIKDDTIDGVLVRRISPAQHAPHGRFVLLNVHGGGFRADSGSLTENIPIAALTGVEVVAVRYRLSPEGRFPAAVDDALAVYRELLKTRQPTELAVYGTSAGAILGPQLLMRLQKEGLPLPAALGVFSGDADWARSGDTMSLYPLIGVDLAALFKDYAGATPLTDPLISPAYGDTSGFPPTLCLSSTRDVLLSGTANFCRRLTEEGVDARLIVFDGLPHAFWAYLLGPESDEAFKQMSEFLVSHLGKR